MTTSADRAWGYRYLILGVAWLLSVISCADRIAVLTFLPHIQKDLGPTAVQVGQPREET